MWKCDVKIVVITRLSVYFFKFCSILCLSYIYRLINDLHILENMELYSHKVWNLNFEFCTAKFWSWIVPLVWSVNPFNCLVSVQLLSDISILRGADYTYRMI